MSFLISIKYQYITKKSQRFRVFYEYVFLICGWESASAEDRFKLCVDF